MYKNQLFLIPLFILAINLIEKSSGFVLSHTHYDIKNKYLLNKYSDSKLFAPNKKNIFKNYAKTFMNLHEDDYKNINSNSSDEYIHISESLGGSVLTQNHSYYLNFYNEDVNSSSEISKDQRFKENETSTTNSTENSSLNTTNSSSDEITDYSFNISDFAQDVLDKWEVENNTNSSNLTNHNSQESIKNEEYFLKTYDESYLNETLNETSIEECNETENQIKQDGFLKKEDFQKYDELFKDNESLAANETINMEYNNIKNDTEMEKQLKTKININY